MGWLKKVPISRGLSNSMTERGKEELASSSVHGHSPAIYVSPFYGRRSFCPDRSQPHVQQVWSTAYMIGHCQAGQGCRCKSTIQLDITANPGGLECIDGKTMQRKNTRLQKGLHKTRSLVSWPGVEGRS